MWKRVEAVKPELERYAGLVHQIKEKSKKQKNLLAKKKETPFYQIPKLHDLTRHIAELTEEIEELKEQAAGMDDTELMKARLAVREEKERSAIERVKAAYGEKFDPLMMFDSRRDVSDLFNEENETRSIRGYLRKKQQQQAQQQQKKTKYHEQER